MNWYLASAPISWCMFLNLSTRPHRINNRATAVNYSGFQKGREGNHTFLIGMIMYQETFLFDSVCLFSSSLPMTTYVLGIKVFVIFG